ncbi:MAG: hypothetical protein N3A72_12470 [bacterium]|nr:hypothetical protein [bacterium]
METKKTLTLSKDLQKTLGVGEIPSLCLDAKTKNYFLVVVPIVNRKVFERFVKKELGYDTIFTEGATAICFWCELNDEGELDLVSLPEFFAITPARLETLGKLSAQQ